MDTKERLGTKNTHIGGNRLVNRIDAVMNNLKGSVTMLL